MASSRVEFVAEELHAKFFGAVLWKKKGRVWTWKCPNKGQREEGRV